MMVLVRSKLNFSKSLLYNGVTLVEILIVFAIILLIIQGIYRFFIGNIRAIKYSLEQASLNENIRNFITFISDDIRKANVIIIPKPIQRESILKITSSAEGSLLKLEHQSLNFKIKPPDHNFIKSEIIEYKLVKNKESESYELYREFISEILTQSYSQTPIKGSRKICGGIKEIKIFRTMKKEPKIHNLFNIPYKSFIEYQPYYLDGTGANLVHIHVTFVRENLKANDISKANSYSFKISLAIRGKLCTVNP